jgi:hypothetical protein
MTAKQHREMIKKAYDNDCIRLGDNMAKNKANTLFHQIVKEIEDLELQLSMKNKLRRTLLTVLTPNVY